MKNKQHIFLYLLFILSTLSLIYSVFTAIKFKSLYCDTVESVFVERRFNKEIINDLEVASGVDLDWEKKVYYSNGEEVLNPLTTTQALNCD